MPDVNPLVAIRDQERALAQKIRAAQERATARIADARARADALKQQAEREGMRDADALYQAGLERARTQADEVAKNGAAQSSARSDAGRAHLARAVESIIAFVLPRTKE